eukprot:877690-Amphidinium_carterae.1
MGASFTEASFPLRGLVPWVAAQVWANVLPKDIRPWMPVLDDFPLGSTVHAAHHVSVPADAPGDI